MKRVSRAAPSRSPKRRGRVAAALVIGPCTVAVALDAATAGAQQGPADPNASNGGNGTVGSGTQQGSGSGAAPTQPATGPQGQSGSGGQTGRTTVPTGIYPYGFAPPAPGQPVGGGNATESSARAITGDETDTFDLAPKGGGAATVRGGASGPVFLDPQGGERPLGHAGPPPSVHTVRKGDTLWGICDSYFHNPYQWPRIWSYNPQIQNPHWIYPNDQIRLQSGNALANQSARTGDQGPGAFEGGRQRVVPETVFLRDEGFVDDESNLDWGSITGAPEDKMFLTDFDEVYLRIGPDHDVHLGQDLTVYRPIRKVSNGQVIQLQGTLRIDQWNAQTRVARAQVTETLEPIERGARIGPIARRFEVIAPVRNEADVRAHVAVAVRPHVFFGQHQVVFIDKGADDGLRQGNRLFVVRRGDAWRGTLGSDRTADRIPLEKDTVAPVEPTPKVRDERALPEEVVGELRVLNVQKKSATCYVSRSRYEIEVNDEAVAHKGY